MKIIDNTFIRNHKNAGSLGYDTSQKSSRNQRGKGERINHPLVEISFEESLRRAVEQREMVNKFDREIRGNHGRKIQ